MLCISLVMAEVESKSIIAKLTFFQRPAERHLNREKVECLHQFPEIGMIATDEVRRTMLSCEPWWDPIGIMSIQMRVLHISC